MGINWMALVNYGIQTDESDFRAHVCTLARKVYVYPTASGAAAIARGQYRFVSARQAGQITAEGYLVPPASIPECASYDLAGWLWGMYAIRPSMTTSEKGDQAVGLVRSAIGNGLIVLPLRPRLVREYAAHWAAMEGRNGYDMVRLPSEWRGAQTERGWLGARRLVVRIWVEAAPALAAYAN